MKPEAAYTCERCHDTGFYRLPPSDEHPNGAMAECSCRLRARRRRHLDQLMRQSGLDADTLRRWSFDTFRPDAALADPDGRAELAQILAYCQHYAQDPQGWLILCGAYGCGKSHLAYATAAAHYRTGRAVYACTVPELLQTLRQGFNSKTGPDSFDARFDLVREADLLLLDDLGAEHATPWGAEKLYTIIDYRYRRRLPLIITTNINLYDPKGRIEPRVLSRILDGANLPEGFSRVYLIPAHDYRLRTPQQTKKPGT
jgi:DNA replication protein DnaC